MCVNAVQMLFAESVMATCYKTLTELPLLLCQTRYGYFQLINDILLKSYAMNALSHVRIRYKLCYTILEMWKLRK